MKLAELLQDKKIQLAQTAANMIYVPLTTDKPFNEISNEMLLTIAKDSDYAKLTLENRGELPSIIPQGASFLTGKAGQDRAVLEADVIAGKSTKTIQVGCIQPSEGGHIQEGTEMSSFIPASLRITALEKRKAGSYEVLWADIRKYLLAVNVQGSRDGALNNFYQAFSKELEEFVAQFELVENQCGAIIFINGKPAGIEIYPHPELWKQIWQLIVRDSYGADAISFIKQGKIFAYKKFINIDKVKDLESLEAEAIRVETETIHDVNRAIEELLEIPVEETKTGSSAGFEISVVSTGEFRGQIIRSKEIPIYISLINNNLIKKKLGTVRTGENSDREE